ncbi:MAG TPA: hypothetical protein VGH50_21525 [Candidatus Binatia bacterium]|jgi:hypothetical protein
MDSKTLRNFIETSGLTRATLLRLIENWRRLQSGASDKKTPGYSGIEN